MAEFDISQLNLKGDIITEKDIGYQDAISRWAANAERRAKVVAFVKNTQDVISSLKFAKQHDLSIAVRGGGHSAGSASSVEGGIVIDLSRYLNQVEIDPSKKLAFVGGGALWEAVDKLAIKHGLATVAGTVNHTGVGGLVLGGGYGWLSASYGLAIDNLVQATVVTANELVLTANKGENADLFFAIRGGGGNFGIVTEFVFQLHPQRSTVYSGVIIYHLSALEQLIKATVAWLETAGEKEGLLQITTVGPHGNPIIVVVPFYNGTESEGRKNFKALLDIGPLSDMSREMPFEELNGLLNPMAMHGRGVYQKGITHKRPHHLAISNAHNKLVDLIKTGNYQGAIIYEYFPLKKINSVAKDETAFRRDVVPNVLINLTWDQKLEDRSEEGRKFASEIALLITESASDFTDSQNLGYSNYDPDATSQSKMQDKARLVFGENYPKLQAIKKRYDPTSIFNKWFPITPA